MREFFPAVSAAKALASSLLAGVLIVASSVFGCLVIFENTGFLDFAINSDTLQLAINVWDYSTHDYARGGFRMSRVPSVVPDLLAYGAIQLATGSWRIASLTYGFFSLLGLAIAAGYIVKDIVCCRWRTAVQVFLLLTLPILLLELPMTAASQHMHIFLPNNHGGPFILALAALCVARKWLERPAMGKLILLFALIAAGVISDLLFVIACVGPIFLVLTLLLIRRRIALSATIPLYLVLAAAVGAARLFDRLLLHEAAPDIEWSAVPEHAAGFLASVGEIAGAAPLTVLLAYVLPLAALLSAPLMLRFQEHRSRPINTFEFWWMASACGVVGAISTTPLLFEGLWHYRYLMPLLWWPIIWASVLAARALGSERSIGVTAGLGGLATLMGLAYLWPGLRAPALLEWHHPAEACLLEGQLTSGLKAGLGDYWVARHLAASSDWRLQIDQIDTDGSALYWDADRFWFTHDVHNGTHPPVYNYIVMARLDEPAIKAHYGPPSRTLDCGGTAVWVYDDVAAFGRALVEGSPMLYATFFEAGINHICVPVDRFYSRSHDPNAAHFATLGGSIEAWVNTPDDQGPQIWGPYLDLPRGRWVISLAYRLASDASGRDHWDITADFRHEKVFEGALAPSLGETRIAQAEIELERPASGIEVRSFLAATSIVEVMGARISRAGSDDSIPCGWR